MYLFSIFSQEFISRFIFTIFNLFLIVFAFRFLLKLIFHGKEENDNEIKNKAKRIAMALGGILLAFMLIFISNENLDTGILDILSKTSFGLYLIELVVPSTFIGFLTGWLFSKVLKEKDHRSLAIIVSFFSFLIIVYSYTCYLWIFHNDIQIERISHNLAFVIALCFTFGLTKENTKTTR